MKKVSALLLAVLACGIVISHAGILAGPRTNASNGHIYFLLSSNSWSGAEAEARSLGGHLVTINDSAENTWVYSNFSTFGNVQRPLWIGLYQANASFEPGGGWTWISKEPVDFINWIPGEPNNNTANNRGPQNWAMIWPPAASSVVSPFSSEHWNDYWNTDNIIDPSLANFHWGIYGVVEISTPPPKLSITRQSGGFLLSWPTTPNALYQVQYRSSLAPAGWTDFGAVIPGTGATNALLDYPIDDLRFYRVFPYP